MRTPATSLPMFHWNVLNPFHDLGVAASWVGGKIGQGVVDLWTAAMLSIWNAGLFVFKAIMNLEDAWLTPDVSTSGPGAKAYAYALWMAGILVVILVIAQLGVAALQRNGRGLARVLIGSGQYVMTWAAWVSYCVVLIAGCGGITRGLMQGFFGGVHLSDMNMWPDFSTKSITDGVIATVLAFFGIVLIFSAIAHMLVYLGRAAALIILLATSQISAAGLVAEFSKNWFWKTVRWVHAAAFTPVIMVMVCGIGVQFTQGVATGMTDTTQQAVATAIPGVCIIAASAVAPLGLFKMLAFVDPGTASGAAMRAGLEAQGGITGFFQHGKHDTGSSTAAQVDEHGTSAGESAAETTSGGRFASVLSGAAPSLGRGLAVANTLGQKSIAVMSDLDSQAGVGHPLHYPDFTGADRSNRAHRGTRPSPDDNNATTSTTGPTTPPNTGTPAAPPPIPPPPTPPAPTPGGGSGGTPPPLPVEVPPVV